MSRKQRVVFAQELKLSAVLRMAAGENVVALAKELGALRKSLYVWRDLHREGGPEALQARRPGPKRGRRRVGLREPREIGEVGATPVVLAARLIDGTAPQCSITATGGDLAAARLRIAELEQKIGQQTLDLDFFHKALRHFKEARRPSDGPGVAASTRSSER